VRRYGQIRLHNFGIYIDRGLWGQTVEVLIDDEAWQIEQAEHLLVSSPCVYDTVRRRIATSTQFLTAKAVAPHMITQGSGVIMMITATPARRGVPLVGGFSVACAAMEGLSRSLAAELGPKAVRVLCLRSAGSPASITDVMDVHAAGHRVTRDAFVASRTDMTRLKRLPSLADGGPADREKMARFSID
jgi:NAD(P)-dependent dehydrogenase (short-subunit alcohol dehydrogenase family)